VSYSYDIRDIKKQRSGFVHTQNVSPVAFSY